MSEYTVLKSEVLDWIRNLGRRSNMFFPQRLGETSFEFARVRQDSELQLEDYDAPMPRQAFQASANPVPPGKLLSPAKETMFRFRKDEGGRYAFTPVFDSDSRILAGVRPCDLHAINLMDSVNSEGAADPYYLTRRQNTAIIAHDCLQPCDEHCFCDAAGSLRTRDGADVFLTPLDGKVLVECLTERGEALVSDAGFPSCNDAEAKKAWAEQQRAKPFGRQLNAPLENIPDILAQQWDSPVWEKHVERCFSCGTCNLVCPTCYCFDVHDDIDLEDTSAGIRYRTVDGCMLEDFSEVAGGHNFRAESAGRQRHRIKRKFEYLPNRFDGGSFCVGCGRCGRQCTVDIDIYDIVNDAINASGVKA